MRSLTAALRILDVVGYRGDMIDLNQYLPFALRAGAMAGLLALGLGLGGCAAGLGDSAASGAFVDPARYDLYDCKQLDTERKKLAGEIAELNGLIAKAKTGVGGEVVADVAYSNSYISARAQAKLADEAWARNRCAAAGPSSLSPNPKPTATPRSGSALY
jgi:hypothetical protein